MLRLDGSSGAPCELTLTGGVVTPHIPVRLMMTDAIRARWGNHLYSVKFSAVGPNGTRRNIGGWRTFRLRDSERLHGPCCGA